MDCPPGLLVTLKTPHREFALGARRVLHQNGRAPAKGIVGILGQSAGRGFGFPSRNIARQAGGTRPVKPRQRSAPAAASRLGVSRRGAAAPRERSRAAGPRETARGRA